MEGVEVLFVSPYFVHVYPLSAFFLYSQNHLYILMGTHKLKHTKHSNEGSVVNIYLNNP